jgi:hypothetical protein
MYQLTTSTSIIRLSDNAFIPAAPGNRDYADFLAWKAEGNTPLPAPAPAPPGPDYIAFWDALTTSTIPSHEHPLRHPLNLAAICLQRGA